MVSCDDSNMHINRGIGVRLYLDDIREPTAGEWIVVRTYDEAVSYVTIYGMPTYISFDHDLGESGTKTGYDFAKWIVEYDQDHDVLTREFDFNVHSANPPGVLNITSLMDNYLTYKFGE